MGSVIMGNVAATGGGVMALDMNGPGHYIHWGFIQMSLANLLVIALMLVVFVLALVLPFPGGRHPR